MDRPRFIWVIFSATLCLLTSSKFCAGVDTLTANQTLADGEFLISPGQIFELGFFSPGSSTNRFLGIRYKATPDVVVWVANRNNPIKGSRGVLTLAENGTLVLSTEQNTSIWSLSSRVASSPILQLLDTGNLVLADKLMASSQQSYTWQSFDYLGDTRLPGMLMVQDPDTGVSTYLTSWKSADDPSVGKFSYRIENQGLFQTVVMENANKRGRYVIWNGRFTGFPILADQAWEPEFVLNKGRLISVSFPFTNSGTSRLTMNYSGLLQQYMMNEQGDGWILMFTMPRDSCGDYGWCGHNGVCKINKTPMCECLKGFKPKSEKEWRIFDWKSGCIRQQPVDCQKEDGFLKVEGIKFPDSLNFKLNTSMNIHECHDECLNDCNCTAYADPYFSNESICLMWFGDLIDMRENVGEVGGGPRMYIRVPVSELGYVTNGNEKNKGRAKTKLVLIAAASGLGMLILGLSFGGLLLRMRRKRQDSKKTRDELELPLFDLETIAAATNNFSRDNMIGEGGFGPVYKGNLSAEQVIAVKRMLKTSGQGHEEFKNEVNLIAKLQHKNLVRLLGCCTDGEEKMLIYEYMQNKSLDYFIFDQNRSGLLTWPTRFDIIMGIAKGLLYLHHDSRLKIIHRDLKASNVLLDENLNAKISDCGLARIFEGNQTTARTKRVVGTYGYMAPEYALEGKFSIKSDIFSLGVVILEIVSGKRNRGFTHPSCYQNLLEKAWFFYKENRELELMDLCYNNSYVESQIKRCIQVGLLCIQNVPDDRPTMSSVVFMLNSEDTALPQPNKPGFLLQRNSSLSNKNASGKEGSGNCSLTISEVEAR
ncbi:hypothetical protein C2S52_012979 [Perilla frutescens var. hirtella]|nr:hypothetical protein C2S52_012979 [Perilla frutescens var. hirtella]